jgi:hypothetical protein
VANVFISDGTAQHSSSSFIKNKLPVFIHSQWRQISELETPSRNKKHYETVLYFWTSIFTTINDQLLNFKLTSLDLRCRQHGLYQISSFYCKHNGQKSCSGIYYMLILEYNICTLFVIWSYTVCPQSPFGVLKNCGAQTNRASHMRFAADYSETQEVFFCRQQMA